MDRCALITGCSSGIGRATAFAFLAEEWDVVATARDETDLHALADAGCETMTLDVTDPDHIESVTESVIERPTGLDCLVNNAGFSQVGPMEDVPPGRLHRQFDVNVYGPHRLTRAVLPHFRDRGDGTIINISSGAGRLSLPGIGAYSASKHALEATSDALRAEVASEGIDVVVVQPGLVATNFHTRLRRELDELDRTQAYADLYRMLDDWAAIDDGGFAFLEPEDVADVVVNAASATQPAPRYAVGPAGRLVRLTDVLPTSLQHRVLRLGLRIAGRLNR